METGFWLSSRALCLDTYGNVNENLDSAAIFGPGQCGDGMGYSSGVVYPGGSVFPGEINRSHLRCTVQLGGGVPDSGSRTEYPYMTRTWAECVFPDTEVLASLQGGSVLAKDLVEGDDIVYYNFETQEDEVGKVYRAFVHEDAAEFVKYEFEDGSLSSSVGVCQANCGNL